MRLGASGVLCSACGAVSRGTLRLLHGWLLAGAGKQQPTFATWTRACRRSPCGCAVARGSWPSRAAGRARPRGARPTPAACSGGAPRGADRLPWGGIVRRVEVRRRGEERGGVEAGNGTRGGGGGGVREEEGTRRVAAPLLTALARQMERAHLELVEQREQPPRVGRRHERARRVLLTTSGAAHAHAREWVSTTSGRAWGESAGRVGHKGA